MKISDLDEKFIKAIESEIIITDAIMGQAPASPDYRNHKKQIHVKIQAIQ